MTGTFAGDEFVLPAEAGVGMKVWLPTVLKIVAPEAGPGGLGVSLSPLAVAGELTDVHDRPVAQSPVTITLGGTSEETTAETGQAGLFAGSVEPRQHGEQDLSVAYSGAEFIKGSQAQMTVAGLHAR